MVGDEARAARDVFRTECETLLGIELGHDIAQNEVDWLAIHDLYSLVVARYLELEPEELLELRQAVSFCEPPTLACGEEWPRDRPGQDNVASATNRRVDVLFFDEDEAPELSAEPAGASWVNFRRLRSSRTRAANSALVIMVMASAFVVGGSMDKGAWTYLDRMRVQSG